MTDSLQTRILAYVQERQQQDAPLTDTTVAAMMEALDGDVTASQIDTALRDLVAAGRLRAENATPLCDLPLYAFRLPS